MSVTVPYEEDSGSPTNERWDANGQFSATRILRCAWANRHLLANQLMGFDGVAYVDPESYPAVPSSIVQNVSIGPDGGIETSAAGSTLNTYQYAVLAVQYGVRTTGSTLESGTGVIMEESLEPSAEFLTQDGQDFYWDPIIAGTRRPLAINEAPARVIRMCDWKISLFNVASIPSGFVSAAGNVNSAAITSLTLGVTFPAETLQYQPGTPTRSFTASGPSRWKLSMSFSARPFSWNMFFRSGRSDPQNIYQADGTIYKPYTPINFRTSLNVVY